MTGKFRNKYRIATARAHWWDYSTPGMYFLTLCAYRHECMFGKIHVAETHGRASLRESPIGDIVLQEWHKSFDIRVELYCVAFVLMPNHLHAILRIDNSVGVNTAIVVETHGRASLRVVNPHVGGNSAPRVVNPTTAGNPAPRVVNPHTAGNPVPLVVNPHTGGNPSPLAVNPTTGVAYRPPESISSFVAGFKSAATKKINVLRNTPGAAVWQPRFHDHIIRNMAEYQRIADYIENNPANWSDDRLWMAML